MADDRFFVDEDMGPEMLDEGVREKFFAALLIIFPENSHEKLSFWRILIGEDSPERLWEEDCEHFEDILDVE